MARLLADRFAERPTWVVVSAARGITDVLERVGASSSPRRVEELLERQERLTGVGCDPEIVADLRQGARESVGRATQRLLAWGERASTAALRYHLSRLGLDIPVVELTTRARLPPIPTALVPGFYLRNRLGRIRCLPRGGSDISAVLVADRIGAPVVRLWKDGGGIRVGPKGIVLEVDGASLLPRLVESIRPLHPAALSLAIQEGIEVILEDPFRRHPATRIVSRNPGSVLAPEAVPAGITLERGGRPGGSG